MCLTALAASRHFSAWSRVTPCRRITSISRKPKACNSLSISARRVLPSLNVAGWFIKRLGRVNTKIMRRR